MSIYDQLTGFVNRGPQRTHALYGILENIGDTASQFLSPRGRQAAMNMVEVGDMINPVAGQYRAGQDFAQGDYVGAMTGLADESQGTFMNLFRRSLDKRADERGLSREEMLLDFLYNKSPLAIGGAGVLGGLQMQNQQDDRGI